MKKLIFGLFFVVISLNSFAQSNSEHLTFKGVPIDGTLNEYVAKMKSAGFSHIGTEDGLALLNGEVAGYKDCIIGAITSKKNTPVYEIFVLFPVQYIWKDLNYDYSKLKSMLTEKYGEPEENIEKFIDTPTYVNINDENDKMDEVKNNRCIYYSLFNVENGTIVLSIDCMWAECRVKLRYLDKLNLKAFEDAAVDVALEQKANPVYEIYPTNNMWNFIKLNTSDGRMWIVQYSIDKDENRFETHLNDTALVASEEEMNGRFKLQPTQNIYTFILLDQINGNTWQVQWSFEENQRFVIPIK